MHASYGDITGRPLPEVMKGHLVGILAFNGIILFVSCLFLNASDDPIAACALALIGFAQFAAAFRGALATTIKDWQVHAALFGMLLATAGALSFPGTIAVLPLLYVWPAIFVGYHFSLRSVVVYGSAITASLAFAAQAAHDAGFISSLIFTGLLSLSLLAVVHWVKRQVATHVAALHESSTHDKLTGIYNRLAFEEFFSEHWRVSSRDALAILDLDHFKQINDAYGHKAGDIALQDFVAIVRRNLRPEDFFARIGGEEFAVIMHDVGSKEAYALCERIRKAVAHDQHARVALTMSAGLVFSPQGQCMADVLRIADKALYSAKASGRNCVRIGVAEPRRDARIVSDDERLFHAGARTVVPDVVPDTLPEVA